MKSKQKLSLVSKKLQTNHKSRCPWFVVELGTKKGEFYFTILLLLGKLFTKLFTFSCLVFLRPTNLMMKKRSYESLKKPTKQKKPQQKKAKKSHHTTKENHQSQKSVGRNDCQHSSVKYILYTTFRCMPSNIPGTSTFLP